MGEQHGPRNNTMRTTSTIIFIAIALSINAYAQEDVVPEDDFDSTPQPLEFSAEDLAAVQTAAKKAKLASEPTFVQEGDETTDFSMDKSKMKSKMKWGHRWRPHGHFPHRYNPVAEAERAAKSVERGAKTAERGAKQVAERAGKATERAAKTVERGAKSALNAAKKEFDKLVNAAKKLADQAVSSCLNEIKKLFSVANDVKNQVMGVVNKVKTVMNNFAKGVMSAIGKVVSCGQHKRITIPDISETTFDITRFPFVHVPNMHYDMCVKPTLNTKIIGDWLLSKAKDFGYEVGRLANIAIPPKNRFHAADGMLVGPSCSRDTSLAFQPTINFAVGGAHKVGGEISIEVGFQVGCMEDIPSNAGLPHHAAKRWVIAPVWGFGVVLKAGKQDPGAGIGANLYFYKPYKYYKYVGHELSLGAAVSGKDYGASAHAIFGIPPITIPNKQTSVDLNWMVPSSLRGGNNLKVSFGYPDITKTKVEWAGAHAAVDCDAKKVLQEAAKAAARAAGEETEFDETTERGLATAKSWERSYVQSKTSGVGFVVEIGYARCCRRFNPSGHANSGHCMSNWAALLPAVAETEQFYPLELIQGTNGPQPRVL